MQEQPYQVQLACLEDSTYVVKNWFGTDQNLEFKVNEDKSITITNAYASSDNIYFVYVDPKANERGDVATASIYTTDEYTYFEGNAEHGHMYIFTWLRDHSNHLVNGGYYEITWGGDERETDSELNDNIQQAVDIQIDSLNRAEAEAVQ